MADEQAVQQGTAPNLSSEPSAQRSEPFAPCPKCEAVQDVALLCGPCADRFADRLMADPAFAAIMAEAALIDCALARYLGSKSPHG